MGHIEMRNTIDQIHVVCKLRLSTSDQFLPIPS